MKMHLTLFCVVVVASMFMTACSKEEEAVSSKFDAKFIAAEADKGNLAPLTELNSACSAEVKKSGSRLTAFKVQDDVRTLRKPMNIRF